MLEREGLVSPDIIRNVSNQITPTPRRRRKNQGIYETKPLNLYLRFHRFFNLKYCRILSISLFVSAKLSNFSVRKNKNIFVGFCLNKGLMGTIVNWTGHSIFLTVTEFCSPEIKNKAMHLKY